ncbi:cobalamin biosynthesis protein [Aminivibrio sp.]|jgi:cobalt-precorrin 5A hydrolase/precorrin-3B C17-methyltransferase|uniref:cobalamin biosynthesis protein n=1 Tax=Aminivibrio sp. TaxID=1872489 RepID=UPI001A58DC27|nr:cobalamin biosynthesis protein [Aminivibrio sp.]MBL3540469.1 bifunctional cobalt-precorrin 5A hydrolase/precorrin-3B C(17)-methyltransferase [Aminivibrio sp.]
MRAAFFCFSAPGEALAGRLAEGGDETVVRVAPGALSETVARWWTAADALVFVSSLGVAVRAAAPHLRDKETDPAVLVVTEDGSTVLPVTCAHLGGGRDFAERIAGRTGASLLLTTSSDRAGLTAPDLLASRRSWKLLGRAGLPAVNRAFLEARVISWWTDVPAALPPMPEGYRPAQSPGEASVIISPYGRDLAPRQVQLVPRCIAAGMGCRRGTDLDTLRRVLFLALEAEGLPAESLAEIRTVEEKGDEPGLSALAGELGVPVVVVDREEILSLDGDFTPSAASRHLGLPGVAEPCAASAGPLLGRRTASDGVTVAFSLLSHPEGGRLTVLGTGPGDGKYLTLEGRRALEEADAVVGYRRYAELLPPAWLRGKTVETYSMGEEEKRVERAVSLAEGGNRVVLLSGGDPVLFGLAALALRTARGRVPASVIPGVTAAQAAGLMTGAPYVNGLALLSLSDYLQPWENVRQALEGAARSGLTIALYNPVKRELDEKLAAVREIFGAAGYSEVHLVRDAGRPGASVRRLPLESLSADGVDMRTLLLLPGSSVERVGDLLLDRRGYRAERAGEREANS